MDFILLIIFIAIMIILQARFINAQHKKTRKDLQEVKTRQTNDRKRQASAWTGTTGEKFTYKINKKAR